MCSVPLLARHVEIDEPRLPGVPSGRGWSRNVAERQGPEPCLGRGVVAVERQAEDLVHSGRPVVEVDDAVGVRLGVLELQPGIDTLGEQLLALAQGDRVDEKVQVVDEPVG